MEDFCGARYYRSEGLAHSPSRQPLSGGCAGPRCAGAIVRATLPRARGEGEGRRGAKQREINPRHTMPCIVSGTGRECSVSASPSDGAREQRSRRGARPRGGVNSARPLTAFPALSSPDNSEAGLRLRISFLFWLTIAQDDGNPPPVRMSWRLLVVSYRAPRSR